jgi:NhaP-type Na+/H+ or K+/H+ antiporter
MTAFSGLLLVANSHW